MEELLGRNSSGVGLENRIIPRESVALTMRYHLQKLALASPTGGGRSVSIGCSRIKATELILFNILI
jgi:hypothetical protein